MKSTPARRKTAIAVPADVLAAVDAAARVRGESRSRFITRILRAAVKARRDAEIVRRLNAIFADESVHAEQIETAAAFEVLAEADWKNERW